MSVRAPFALHDAETVQPVRAALSELKKRHGNQEPLLCGAVPSSARIGVTQKVNNKIRRPDPNRSLGGKTPRTCTVQRQVQLVTKRSVTRVVSAAC